MAKPEYSNYQSYVQVYARVLTDPWWEAIYKEIAKIKVTLKFMKEGDKSRLG